MKAYKKNWLIRLLFFALLGLIFVFELGIIGMDFTGYRSGQNFYDLIKQLGDGNPISYISLIIVVFIYGFILVFFLSLFFKRLKGLLLPVIYQFILFVGLICYQVVYQYFSNGALALLIIGIILNIGAFSLSTIYAFCNRNAVPSNKEYIVKSKLVFLLCLLADIFVAIGLIAIFFVPVYSYNDSTSSLNDHNCVLANFISNVTEAKIMDSIMVLVFFILYIVEILFLISLISSFVGNKKKFMEESKSFFIYSIFLALVFFVSGYLITIIYTYQDDGGFQTKAFIPLIIVGIVYLFFAICSGLYADKTEKVKSSKRKRRINIGPMAFSLVTTAITFFSLFFNIIKITFTTKFGTEKIELTGFDLLRDYPDLGGGYQFLAFFIIVMLVCSGIFLLFTLTSGFGKYKYANRIAKISVFGNALFILVLGLSGFYFTIAQKMTLDSIEQLLKVHGYSLSGISKSSMTTDGFYAIIADVLVIMVMLISRCLNNNEPIEDIILTLNTESEESPLPVNLTNDSVPGLASEEVASEEVNEESEEITQNSFDPCPAFSEIDEQIPAFKVDYENRMAMHASNPTLNGLVNFVVNYAKNCRLHLSYSVADMATFVAGLGACRLSILQGMSGTGKTSLPKIFMEAIKGNCEIIEVESSWKDKNELLGYYNEFSQKYTPKKFTQALYKASLNTAIPTFIILDEMNLSRIEYYFSDFLSLMENEEDKREIKLLNIRLIEMVKGEEVHYQGLKNDHTIKVPANIWFIGTANRDESTFVISDKVYDRAHTMNFNKRAKKVREFGDVLPQEFYTYEDISKLFIAAKQNGLYDAEDDEIIKAVEVILAPYNISFGNRILKQIEDFVNIYCACFPNADVKATAVEKILLSKVVSKLEVKIIENKELLEREFEALKLFMCSDFIKSLSED